MSESFFKTACRVPHTFAALRIKRESGLGDAEKPELYPQLYAAIAGWRKMPQPLSTLGWEGCRLSRPERPQDAER